MSPISLGIDSSLLLRRMVVGVGLLPRLLLGKVLKQFRIVDLGGDHVAAAGPLAQVNGAAAVAAEGKVLARPEHKRAADGAAQGNGFFLRHTQLDVGRWPNDLLLQRSLT